MHHKTPPSLLKRLPPVGVLFLLLAYNKILPSVGGSKPGKSGDDEIMEATIEPVI